MFYRLYPFDEFTSLLWPSTGIALACLLLFGFRIWPAIFSIATLANILSGFPFVTSLGIAASITAEAYLITFFLNSTGFHKSLSRTKDILSLIFFAGILSTMAGPALGIFSLWVGHVRIENIGPTWITWWLDNFLSDLTIAPFILVWFEALKSKKKFNFSFWSISEALLLTSILLGISFSLFSGTLNQTEFKNLTLTYVFFSLVVWASMRFDQFGSTAVVFMTSILSEWGTRQGFGPFSHGDPRENFILLHGFMAVFSITGMSLAASVTERKAAIESRRKSENSEKFLNEASEILNGSLNYESRLSKLASLTIPTLADWCLIDVVDDDGQLHRVCWAHNDPVKTEHLIRLKDLFAPIKNSPQPAVKVFNSGTLIHLKDISDETIRKFAFNDEHASLIKNIGTKSCLTVPLIFKGKISGVLSLGRSTRTQFEESEITLVEQLASRAALAIDNAKLYSDVQRGIKVRDDFLSVASHELRTPLTSLYLQLQMIDRMVEKAENVPLSIEKLRERIDLSKRQSKHLANLIDGLLDVSKLGSHKLTITKEAVDVAKLTNDVVTTFIEEAKYSGTELVLNESKNIVGNFDKLRLTQAISNLVSNSMKYGVGKPIDVYLKSDRKNVQIIVRDHGIGISPQDHERIFERFERAIPYQNISGMGLGLYITREIARAHGGSIQLQSKPGDGSTFILELPLSDEESLRDEYVN